MTAVQIPEDVIERFEDSQRLWGVKTRDIHIMAHFRVKFRDQFHRLAELNLGIGIFQAMLATGLHYPLQWLAWFGLVSNALLIIHAETKAATFARQLNRRAAEQILRDVNEIGG
jgi:hypothetical protein